MKNIIVLGLGNGFWADEGFGMRAVEALHRRYMFPDNVTLIDGGTEGMAFLPLVEDADVLLIVDAVDFGRRPGTVSLLDDAAVARRLRKHKNWLQQTSLVDALDAARQAGQLPSRIRMVSVQPLDSETYGNHLSKSAEAQVDEAVTEMVKFLARVGITATPRPDNIPPEPLSPAVVDLSALEAGCFA